MKQKTRIASKLFAALVVLTLISCCFLGTTMARYTSAGTGKATVQVAKWDIAFNETNSGTISFGPISPNMTGYDDANNQNQTNPITPSTMVVITNNSEVSAKVTVVISDITYTAVSGGSVTFGNGMTYSNGEVSGTPTQEQVENALRFAVTVTGAKQDDTYTYTDGSVAYVGTLNGQSSATESISVSASLTWVTAYSTTQSDGVLEDAIDTWIGENIASLSISVSYTAVQASELP